MTIESTMPQAQATPPLPELRSHLTEVDKIYLRNIHQIKPKMGAAEFHLSQTLESAFRLLDMAFGDREVQAQLAWALMTALGNPAHLAARYRAATDWAIAREEAEPFTVNQQIEEVIPF